MTFIDWFLIQAPSIREVFVAKAVVGVFFCMFAPIFDVSRRWIILIAVYAGLCATISSILPGRREVEQIKESMK